MKRIGLFLLAAVMAFGMVACSSNKDADPVGTWDVTAKSLGSTIDLRWFVYERDIHRPRRRRRDLVGRQQEDHRAVQRRGSDLQRFGR